MAKGAGILTITVDASIEEEFNKWYNEYLKRMLRAVPEFESVTRYVSGTGKKNYCSFYVISDANKIPEAKANVYGEDRKPDSVAWNEWVAKGIVNEYWDFFIPMYTLTQGDVK